MLSEFLVNKNEVVCLTFNKEIQPTPALVNAIEIHYLNEAMEEVAAEVLPTISVATLNDVEVDCFCFETNRLYIGPPSAGWNAENYPYIKVKVLDLTATDNNPLEPNNITFSLKKDLQVVNFGPIGEHTNNNAAPIEGIYYMSPSKGMDITVQYYKDIIGFATEQEETDFADAITHQDSPCTMLFDIAIKEPEGVKSIQFLTEHIEGVNDEQHPELDVTISDQDLINFMTAQVDDEYTFRVPLAVPGFPYYGTLKAIITTTTDVVAQPEPITIINEEAGWASPSFEIGTYGDINNTVCPPGDIFITSEHLNKHLIVKLKLDKGTVNTSTIDWVTEYPGFDFIPLTGYQVHFNETPGKMFGTEIAITAPIPAEVDIHTIMLLEYITKGLTGFGNAGFMFIYINTIPLRLESGEDTDRYVNLPAPPD